MNEIGWLNFRDGKFLHMKAKKWGGTRKICVSKNCCKDQLIAQAKKQFFPGQKMQREMFKIL